MKTQQQPSPCRHDRRAAGSVVLVLKSVAVMTILFLLVVQWPAHGQNNLAKRRNPSAAADAGQKPKSIEEITKVHRLSTTKRAIYDAFAYVNRVPDKAEKGESPIDFAGRILGRLANQEGRILIKLPARMDRESYLGMKIFLRYEGKAKVGHCAACHAPPEFTDLKHYVVTIGGAAKPTPSLRNLKKRKVDIRAAILGHMESSRAKRSGRANDIAAPFAAMNITKNDVPRLVSFLHLLNDVPDKEFRNLILNVKLLDTSNDIE